MFDTHCHLNDPRLNGNLEKIIHEAKNAGVNLLLIPGYDLNSSYEAVRIAKTNKKITPRLEFTLKKFINIGKAGR